MLNSVSVSLNRTQTPLFAKYQTNPFLSTGIKADTFERVAEKSIANISFTSVDDSIIGKSIRELKDVPCPYCGQAVSRQGL